MTREILAIVAALGLAAPYARAEALDAAAIVEKVKATQEAHKDFEIDLAGELHQAGRVQRAALAIQAIPGRQLRRVTFKAPPALAGNFVIIDRAQAFRYVALPHQVFVSSVEAATRNAPLDFSAIAKVVDGSLGEENIKVVGTEMTPAGEAHVLEGTVDKKSFKVWILAGQWRLHRLQAFDAAGQLKADMTVEKFAADTGLEPAALKALPEDAEVIRR